MDVVKRKVLLDLFASPSTLLPVAGGLTLLMGSWALGGVGLVTFAGLASLLAGVGMFATRFIFGLEQITERAYQYAVQQQQLRQQEALDELDQALTSDRDPRTESCLRQLRQIYQSLGEDVRNGKIAKSSSSVLEAVDRTFLLCVEHLRQTRELWEKSQRLVGSARARILAQRDEMIREVADSVAHLDQTIHRLQRLTDKQQRSELARIRQELDESLHAARRAEQRVAEMTGEEKPYDVSEFERS